MRITSRTFWPNTPNTPPLTTIYPSHTLLGKSTAAPQSPFPLWTMPSWMSFFPSISLSALLRTFSCSIFFLTNSGPRSSTRSPTARRWPPRCSSEGEAISHGGGFGLISSLEEERENEEREEEKKSSMPTGINISLISNHMPY